MLLKQGFSATTGILTQISTLKYINGAEKPVSPVDFVNLEHCTDLWYEIANIPNRFQKTCVKKYQFK